MPLTVRHADLRAHAGEISLPGGARMPTDASLEATALREAWEEIGVEPAASSIIGALDDVWIPVSNFELRPFVGTTAARPRLRAAHRRGGRDRRAPPPPPPGRRRGQRGADRGAGLAASGRGLSLRRPPHLGRDRADAGHVRRRPSRRPTSSLAAGLDRRLRASRSSSSSVAWCGGGAATMLSRGPRLAVFHHGPPYRSVTVAPARSAMSPAAAMSHSDRPPFCTKASNRPRRRTRAPARRSPFAARSGSRAPPAARARSRRGR